MKFSILIPNLNYSKYLFDCLKSVVNQRTTDHFSYDIFICDQSENEIYEKIVKEINEIFPNAPITIFHNDIKSVTLARHSLLSKCDCDYFYFVDSDDYIDLDTLERVYSLLFNYDYPDILAFDYVICDEDGNDSKIQRKKPDDFEKNYIDYFYFTNMANSLCTKVFKRSLYFKNDYSDFSNGNGEDFLMNEPMIRRAKKIVFERGFLPYHYRKMTGTRITKTTVEDCVNYLEKRAQLIRHKKNNVFQKSIRLNSLLAYFDSTVSAMIKSKLISWPEFLKYFLLIKKYIVSEELFQLDKLRKKQRLVFRLLINNKSRLLFFIFKVKAKG